MAPRRTISRSSGINHNDINDVLSLFSKDYSFLQFNTQDPAFLDNITFEMVSNGNLGNMMLNLKQKPPDAIWESILTKDDRYRIRMFERDGFEVRAIEERHDLERFYQYYSATMNHIDGQILPFSFFERLMDSFSPNELMVMVLTKDDIFAGGSLALMDPVRKTFYGKYLAINRDLPNRYTPTHCIIWESINWAWNNGYETMSFGRQSLDPKNPRFQKKLKFGAEYVPIHSYVVLLSKAASLLYRSKITLARSHQRFFNAPEKKYCQNVKI